MLVYTLAQIGHGTESPEATTCYIVSIKGPEMLYRTARFLQSLKSLQVHKKAGPS